MEPPTLSPTDALKRCLAAYRDILRLTAEQEALLRRGDYGPLVELLTRKDHLVGEAARLWAEAQAASAEERARPAFAGAVREVQTLVAELVEAERRCHELLPAAGAAPRAPARRAVSAYQKK